VPLPIILDILAAEYETSTTRPAMNWPTIVDPNDDGLSGGDLGDLQPGAERQTRVRSGQGMRIEFIATPGAGGKSTEHTYFSRNDRIS
jgi:hypothetical protein